MSSFLFDRRRSERFAEWLDGPDRLRRHRRLSRSEAELDWGRRVWRRLDVMPHGVHATPEFREGLRAMLMMAATQREDQTTVASAGTATSEAAGPLGSLAATKRSARPVARSHRTPSTIRSASPGSGRTRAAVLVGVTAGALALSGVSAASTDSLPGDALYQVKRSSERAQLALAASDLTRGRLYLEFAHSRIQEAHQIGTGMLAEVLADMDGETISGINLLTTAAVQRGDANILSAVTAFITQQRARLSDLRQTLTASGIEPMRTSMRLLDSIEYRAAALTYALLKNCPIAAADKLGPKPGNC